MKTITIQKKPGQTALEQMSVQLGCKVTVQDNEFQMTIDNAYAKGSIRQFNLKNGIICLDYDIVFYEDLILSNATDDFRIYDFIYVSDSHIHHSFAGEERQKLSKFQPSIFSSVPNVDSRYHFSKDQNYKFCMVQVSARAKNSVENSVLMQKLQSIFSTSQTEKNFAYIGSFNLSIADKIKQLRELDGQGIVRSLMAESLIKTILAFELQQYSDDLTAGSSNTGSLTTKEMINIRNLSTIIEEHPEDPYSINSLCEASGLSKTKIQEGFRLMHGVTVTHYIKHIRILAAEKLIKTTDLNISEIVYSIGLTSRSYFSKIFKEKFNCSPKHYQENQKAKIMC